MSGPSRLSATRLCGGFQAIAGQERAWNSGAYGIA